jgi:hypothetical protein
MKRERFGAWLRNIYETQDVEISCTECFELVSSLVEAEVSGRDVAAEFPRVTQHLEQCRACRDEFESLLDLRHVEDSSGLMSLQDLRDLIG